MHRRIHSTVERTPLAKGRVRARNRRMEDSAFAASGSNAPEFFALHEKQCEIVDGFIATSQCSLRREAAFVAVIVLELACAARFDEGMSVDLYAPAPTRFVTAASICARRFLPRAANFAKENGLSGATAHVPNGGLKVVEVGARDIIHAEKTAPTQRSS